MRKIIATLLLLVPVLIFAQEAEPITIKAQTMRVWNIVFKEEPVKLKNFTITFDGYVLNLNNEKSYDIVSYRFDDKSDKYIDQTIYLEYKEDDLTYYIAINRSESLIDKGEITTEVCIPDIRNGRPFGYTAYSRKDKR